MNLVEKILGNERKRKRKRKREREREENDGERKSSKVVSFLVT